MPSIAKYSASLIAKWFLAENMVRNIQQDSDSITNLKLQKLLYYAQGTYYALKNCLLFNDAIVAWEHGPVVEKVYHEYKANGSNGIQFNEDFEMSQIDNEDMAILKDVFDVFGQYYAWKLRNMTHEEDPWKNTPQNQEINVDVIREYFLKEYIQLDA